MNVINSTDELQKKIAELEEIFDLSLYEIFITDAHGTCVKVNPICADNIGLKPEDLIGRNVRDLVNEGIFMPSATLKVLEEKQPVTLIQTTVSGKKLHLTSTPVFNGAGEITLVISNAIDITNLFSLKDKVKEMEQVIENYNKQNADISSDQTLYGKKIIAKNPVMIQILELLMRVSRIDSTVLLLGESGVGKTEIAKWIHERSNRSQGDFIEISCDSIPSSLFESELFGYEAGSFSGALSLGRQGLLEAADNGTLFLDEIGELSLDLQTKLLQVIESKSFKEIGSDKARKINTRIIAATSKSLKELVDQGKFHKELYIHISIIPIKIPPLRERRDELIELIFSLLDRINIKYNSMKILSPKLLEELITHDWPGNIRELENTLERLVVTTNDTVIDRELSTPPVNEKRSAQQNETEQLLHSEKYLEVLTSSKLSLDERLDMVEKEILEYYMEKLGSTRKVAKYLQTSQSTVSRKCLKYNIKLNQK
ncbi:sigma-54 interaction domain-containing protein [Bacillus sp. JJ722]|uniref:sigma-54 interaction domain-containing protein n=1 Tax=Bacillus sp. JJ722 TaxID=3122973 RepID=UPI002FFE1370